MVPPPPSPLGSVTGLCDHSPHTRGKVSLARRREMSDLQIGIIGVQRGERQTYQPGQTIQPCAALQPPGQGILNPSAAMARDCSAPGACSDVCSVHWPGPPVVQRCKLRSSPADIMSISMHQWNSEKKQRTFQNSRWAGRVYYGPNSSRYLYSSDIFTESSFDRLGTGNVICYLPGVLSQARRETPGQLLNVARQSPSPPQSEKL